jgi:hypothetical protein
MSDSQYKPRPTDHLRSSRVADRRPHETSGILPAWSRAELGRRVANCAVSRFRQLDTVSQGASSHPSTRSCALCRCELAQWHIQRGTNLPGCSVVRGSLCGRSAFSCGPCVAPTSRDVFRWIPEVEWLTSVACSVADYGLSLRANEGVEDDVEVAKDGKEKGVVNADAVSD